jgi:murein L,D-transpeptidase YafK
MIHIFWQDMSKQLYRVMLAAATAVVVTACSQTEDIPPAMQPLTKEAMHLLGEKGMRPDTPIFVRIFKEESELEVWKAREDGHYYHFKTYPICVWSGDLGPKLQQGDKQAPEGFYKVTASQMNPNSKFHLSFNLGYPNAYDRSYGRTGDALMVHGDCRSAGCYAMTDALIEEIYALARESFAGGQEYFYVHAMPFRMTDENMERHRKSKHYAFWKQLKEGYDYFELTRQPPNVEVCSRRYLVNAKFQNASTRVDPAGPCPPFYRPKPTLWAGSDPVTVVAQVDANGQPIKTTRVVAPGTKLRNLDDERRKLAQGIASPFGLTDPGPYGLTKAGANQSWLPALTFGKAAAEASGSSDNRASK